MVIGTTTENQACSPFRLFKPCLLCVSILVPSVVLSSFFGLGFSVILFTATVLILSTSFLVKLSKKTKVVSEGDNGIVNEFQAGGSLDLTSEREISSFGSGFRVSGEMELNPENSDEYSTSDDEEEGLIEIAIPSNEEPKQNTQSNLPSLWAESVFQQQDFVELLAEINEANEEESLIEIDISMGSIKCPASEIEA